MNLDVYFPTPVWWEDLTINNTEILDFCHKMQSENPVGRRISNIGGWQSDDIGPTDHPELKSLIDAIYEKTKFCLETYGFVPESVNMTIGNLWININKESDSNAVHTHTSAFLSGVYYVKASRNSAPIVFYKNFAEDAIITSIAPVATFTQLSGSTAKYPPRAGRLVMFPAWLPHSVLPNPADEERISIAFNIKMKQC